MSLCEGREGLVLVPCQGAATHRARLFPSFFPGDLGEAERADFLAELHWECG